MRAEKEDLPLVARLNEALDEDVRGLTGRYPLIPMAIHPRGRSKRRESKGEDKNEDEDDGENVGESDGREQ